jgi:hypothetical protein
LIRWSPSPYTTISLSEIFTNHGTGTNGGIDHSQSQDIFNDLSAIVKYKTLDERVFRHDLTLSYTSILTDDSSNCVSGSVFLSHSDWNRRLNQIIVNNGDSTKYDRYISRYFGANLTLENHYSFVFMKAGGELLYNNIENSILISGSKGISGAAYILVKTGEIFGFTLTAGARLHRYFDSWAKSAGVKPNLKISDNTSFFFDLSYSERLPSLVEGLGLTSEKHYLAIFNFDLKLTNTSLSLGAFTRRIDQPIVLVQQVQYDSILTKAIFKNSEGRTILGAYLNAETRFLDLFVTQLFVQSYYSQSAGKNIMEYPTLYAGFSTYIEIKRGSSILQIGTQVSGTTKFDGLTFDPQTRSYFANQQESQLMTNGINLFANARLGDADIRVSFENVLSQGYYYIPYYPELDRNFRLSFSWSFLN